MGKAQAAHSSSYVLDLVGLSASDEIQMGDNRYAGEVAEMAGNLKGGYSGGYVLANDPGFVKDVEQQYVMMVMPEGVEPFEVDLTGTKKAVAAARECNAAQS